MALSRRSLLSLTAIVGLAPLIHQSAPRVAAMPLLPSEMIPVDGAALDAALAALEPYAGGDKRIVTVLPGRYVRSQGLRVPPGVHLVATGCTFVLRSQGAEDAVLDIRDTHDVIVEGGIWDGDRTRVSTATEYRHAIRVVNSERVALINLVARNSKGDGVYVGSALHPAIDVSLTTVTCTGNHRNGISITAARGFQAVDCHFDANGRTAPMAGATIEPNHEDAIIEDIGFTRCTFSNNGDRGVLVRMRRSSLMPAAGITITDSSLNSNGRRRRDGSLTGGLVLLRPRVVRLRNCRIAGNQVGVRIEGARPGDTGTAPGVFELAGSLVERNLREGVLVSNAIFEVHLRNTRVLKNSRRSKGSYSGINVAQGKRILLTDSRSSGAKAYGLRCSRGVRAVLTRSSLAGNRKGRLYAKGARVSTR